MSLFRKTVTTSKILVSSVSDEEVVREMDWDFRENSAMLIIDMLNDFIKEGGALVVPGAQRILPYLQEVLQKARSSGLPVIFVADSHLEGDREFQRWPAHALADTWGGRVVDELAPLAGEYLVRKRRFSAFFGTDLDLLLRELDVREVYLGGVLTNICVYATALDAAMRGYGVHVLEKGVASLSRETDEFIFRQLEEVLGAELVK